MHICEHDPVPEYYVQTITHALMRPYIVEPSEILTTRREGWLPSGLYGIVSATQDATTLQIKLETCIMYRLWTGDEFPISKIRTLNDDCSVAGYIGDKAAFDLCDIVSHWRHGYTRKIEFDDLGGVTTPMWTQTGDTLVEVCPAIPFLGEWSRFAAIFHCGFYISSQGQWHTAISCSLCLTVI